MNQDSNSNNNNNNNHNHNSCNSTMNDDNGAHAEKGSSSNGDGLSNQLSGMSIEGNSGGGSSSSSSSSSSKKKKKDTCLNCLKQVEGCSRCSKCRTALYCNRVCQLKHWPVHKNSCQDSNNAEDSDEKLHMKADNHLKQGNN